MEMEEISLKARLEASYKNLERVNFWIDNADRKAGTILTFNSVLMGFLVTRGLDIADIFKQGDRKDLMLLSSLLLGYLVIVGLSVWRAVKVFVPSIKPRESYPSLFFFATIASLDIDEFKSKMSNLDDNRILDELHSQTHINSGICTKKFKNIRFATNCLLISVPVWFLTLLLVTLFKSFN